MKDEGCGIQLRVMQIEFVAYNGCVVGVSKRALISFIDYERKAFTCKNKIVCVSMYPGYRSIT
jgi:hypothetical protein